MTDEELDRILAAGLADYSAAEPRTGLEQRVLARVRAAERPANGIWGRLALTVPVVAALLIAAVLFRTKPQVPAKVASAQPPAVTEPARVREAPAAVHPRRVARRAAAKQTVVFRRDQFPMPAPLSPEERALLDL